MKKTSRTETERQPLDVGAKMLEIKKEDEEARKTAKGLHLRGERMDEARREISARESFKSAQKAGAQPISLKVVRTHSLGDFRGKFHPSKSTKGIKRSE